MYIPVNLENVEILKSNFNMPNSLINDDFIEVLNHKHIKLSYVFDGVSYFLPVVECKTFNTKNFTIRMIDESHDFNEIDRYYFIYFSDKYSIFKNSNMSIENLSILIIKMYFKVVKCIKYELHNI